MLCYRRENSFYRMNNKENRLHLPGQSRRYHQHRGQEKCQNDTTYTSGHDIGVLCSPVSPGPGPAPRTRFGAANNPGGNTLVRQPGTLRITAIDSSTAVRQLRQHCRGAPLLVPDVYRVLLLARPITQQILPLSRAHGLVYRRWTILTT